MQTTEINETVGLLNKQFELVKGDFSPEDTKDILNHLISKKIKFHELRNFSSEIRFGTKDENSLIRIAELKAAKAELGVWIDLANAEGKTLRVNSSISIDFV